MGVLCVLHRGIGHADTHPYAPHNRLHGAKHNWLLVGLVGGLCASVSLAIDYHVVNFLRDKYAEEKLDLENKLKWGMFPTFTLFAFIPWPLSR